MAIIVHPTQSVSGVAGRVLFAAGAALLLLTEAGCRDAESAVGARPSAESPTPPSAEPIARLELQPAGAAGGFVFVVTGFTRLEQAELARLEPDEREKRLRAYVEGDLPNPPPLAGDVALADGVLTFTPRYDLQPGMRYRAEFARGADSGGTLTGTFQLPAPPRSEPTRIVAVYPSSGVLPENQLKFYFEFSAPMSRGEAYRHIRLLDEAGHEIEGAFLELDEELWNPAQTRFTLLCDPGRVKRELAPREELGPVLREGQRYRLTVNAAWRDARGNRLIAGALKVFDVVAADTTPVDPATWSIAAPTAGSREPLLVKFPEPLDYALVTRVIQVRDARGQTLTGRVRTANQEMTWKFIPDDPWDAQPHQLVVETTLEDLAGNSIGRPFEVDTSAQRGAEPAPSAAEAREVTLPIPIAPPSR
ncbi:MAG: hypothetical protein JNG90_00985 [Planctomycetaceae bacterium]|nr:hypothetical protein [Planctomycetaceae bacterium]